MSVALAISRNTLVPMGTMSLWAKRLGTTSSAPRKASCSTERPIAVGTGKRSLTQNAVLSGLRMAFSAPCRDAYRQLRRSLVEHRHEIEVGILCGPEVAGFDI